MLCTHTLEAAILDHLARLGPCGFDQLVRALPAYSWNQIFHAVDHLSREGALNLRKSSRFAYSISPAAPGTAWMARHT
jgi:hypothetical protein